MYIVPAELSDTFMREGRNGVPPVLRLIKLDFSVETFQVAIASLESKS